MGRNSAIKSFDPAKETGQPLDLFSGRDARRPVIIELLRSPWIVRGSQVATGNSGHGGKRREEEVTVVWDGARRAPAAFQMNGRRYSVDALVQTWTLERAWWDPRARLSRRCFRVLARGGLYDLAYDLLTGRWLLVGIVD
ncbi:MAG: hypothetical protein CVT59_00595 [Actinobacteria bacterium HGW-Actinobacteria-1]|jgi:hypothetical protein|nr:MAG: hypothetical protein CVT59_00595 [Actinobacteria bacterium HGW-Actinobacteria-1]